MVVSSLAMASQDEPAPPSTSTPAPDRSPVDENTQSNTAYTQAQQSAADAGLFGLAGDGFGVRRALTNVGVDLGASLILDNVWNTHGGADTGYALLSLLNLNIAVRTEPLLKWKGGRFYIAMLSYGQSRDPFELVPTYWGWEGIASGEGSVTQMSELWYEQEFLDRFLTLRFGKQDANSTFGVVPGGGAFISTAGSYPAPLIQYFPTYPRQAVGVDLALRPTEWLTGRVGWFDGSANYYDASRGTNWPNTGTRGPKSFFDNPGSWFFISELDAQWSVGTTPLPGSAAIGYWWQTGAVSFTTAVVDPADPSAMIDSTYVTEGSEGLYLGGSQTLFNLSGDAAATQSVGLFSQIGFGQGASNPSTFSLIAGVNATGLIPGRGKDQFGVQYNMMRFSNDERVWQFPGATQQSVEVFYRLQITPALAIQPDFQWIHQPAGDSSLDDAYIAILRVQLAF